MAEVESMQQGTEFGGVDSVNLPFLDGPSSGESPDANATETEVPEQPSEADAPEQETESAEQPSYSKDPVINDLIINKFAKDHPELDPANPAHLKILNRMANQEKYIRELKTKTQPQDRLTDFERSVMNPTAASPAPVAQPELPAAPAPGVGKPYFEGDPGVAWKSPNDAYAQMAQAWTKEGGPDFETLNKVDQGIFHRRAQAFGYLTAEQAQEMVERTIQDRLGDVLPHVRETVEMQISQQDKEFALAELSKSEEWADIAQLETVDNAEPLVVVNPFTGKQEQHENTPLNRILADNPEILEISITRNAKGQLLSKRDSERLTYMARFRAAGRISKRGQMDEGKASKILEAGAKQAERQNGDRVRQGLNGGRGATGLPNGKKTGSLVHELVNDGGPRSFSSF
jgi:hypothetical protein